jgi:hypothetical protein
MDNLFTKPVAAMTEQEVMIAAKIGRLKFDRENSSPNYIKKYDDLPSRECLLRQYGLQESDQP